MLARTNGGRRLLLPPTAACQTVGHVASHPTARNIRRDSHTRYAQCQRTQRRLAPKASQPASLSGINDRSNASTDVHPHPKKCAFLPIPPVVPCMPSALPSPFPCSMKINHRPYAFLCISSAPPCALSPYSPPTHALRTTNPTEDQQYLWEPPFLFNKGRAIPRSHRKYFSMLLNSPL